MDVKGIAEDLFESFFDWVSAASPHVLSSAARDTAPIVVTMTSERVPEEQMEDFAPHDLSSIKGALESMVCRIEATHWRFDNRVSVGLNTTQMEGFVVSATFSVKVKGWGIALRPSAR